MQPLCNMSKRQSDNQKEVSGLFGLELRLFLPLLILGAILLFASKSFSQNNPCSVSLSANPTVVPCGSPVQLNASASGGSFCTLQ